MQIGRRRKHHDQLLLIERIKQHMKYIVHRSFIVYTHHHGSGSVAPLFFFVLLDKLIHSIPDILLDLLYEETFFTRRRGISLAFLPRGRTVLHTHGRSQWHHDGVRSGESRDRPHHYYSLVPSPDTV